MNTSAIRFRTACRRTACRRYTCPTLIGIWDTRPLPSQAADLTQLIPGSPMSRLSSIPVSALTDHRRYTYRRIIGCWHGNPRPTLVAEHAAIGAAPVDADLILRRQETASARSAAERRGNEPVLPVDPDPAQPELTVAGPDWPWTLATALIILVALVAGWSCLP